MQVWTLDHSECAAATLATECRLILRLLTGTEQDDLVTASRDSSPLSVVCIPRAGMMLPPLGPPTPDPREHLYGLRRSLALQDS